MVYVWLIYGSYSCAPPCPSMSPQRRHPNTGGALQISPKKQAMPKVAGIGDGGCVAKISGATAPDRHSVRNVKWNATWNARSNVRKHAR